MGEQAQTSKTANLEREKETSRHRLAREALKIMPTPPFSTMVGEVENCLCLDTARFSNVQPDNSVWPASAHGRRCHWRE